MHSFFLDLVNMVLNFNSQEFLNLIIKAIPHSEFMSQVHRVILRVHNDFLLNTRAQINSDCQKLMLIVFIFCKGTISDHIF